MTRAQLYARIAGEYPALRPAEVRRVVDAILEVIVSRLAGGDVVRLRGFGVFTPTARRGRRFHDPRLRTFGAVEASTTVMFRAAEPLLMRINPWDSSRASESSD